jgi:hypothetical protein
MNIDIILFFHKIKVAFCNWLQCWIVVKSRKKAYCVFGRFLKNERAVVYFAMPKSTFFFSMENEFTISKGTTLKDLIVYDNPLCVETLICDEDGGSFSVFEVKKYNNSRDKKNKSPQRDRDWLNVLRFGYDKRCKRNNSAADHPKNDFSLVFYEEIHKHSPNK